MTGKIFVALAWSLAAVAVAWAQEPRAKLERDEAVRCFVFAPAGSRQPLLASAAEKSIYLWNYSTGKPLAEARPTRHGPAYGLAFSTDGTRLAIGCKDDVLVWDLSDPAKIKVVAE